MSRDLLQVCELEPHTHLLQTHQSARQISPTLDLDPSRDQAGSVINATWQQPHLNTIEVQIAMEFVLK